MKHGRHIYQLRHLILMALFAPLVCSAEAEQFCEDKIVNILRAAWQIGTEGKIRAASCKAWPDDKNKTLVVIAYEPPNYPAATNYQLPIYIAMVDPDRLNILSAYEGSINEDAVTYVDERSLKFDTARYFLAKDVRAFGLRVSANVEPKFSEGGYDDLLSLYVLSGTEIRPVLMDLPMRHWTYEGGFPGGPGNYITRLSTFTLTTAQTFSFGFADLLISAKTTGSKKTRKYKLRYGGNHYPFDMIDLRIKLSGSK